MTCKHNWIKITMSSDGSAPYEKCAKCGDRVYPYTAGGPIMTPTADEIGKAIKATEYKYFGDYEMSDDQREAVDVLVEAARYAIQAMNQRGAPDAWMYTSADCRLFRTKQDLPLLKHGGWTETPLYK